MWLRADRCFRFSAFVDPRARTDLLITNSRSRDDRHLQELEHFGYADLTENDANSKLDEVIAIQQARLDTEKSFIPKLRSVLSPVKVARFFQIDSKLRALLQCDIARSVPLVK